MSPPAAEHERALALFGTRVRILIGAPLGAEHRAPALAAMETEALLRTLERELTRFDPESALCRLNADPAREVRTTRAVALLIAAARAAAIESGGLVDAAVIDGLERAGYAGSRAGTEPADLRDALAAAPARRPAEPTRSDRWSAVEVDLAEAVVRRPPGMRIDSGGAGKGLAADLAAARLGGFSSFAVDCGGDVRIGGGAGLERTVEVIHPFDPAAAVRLTVADGAVATSGLRTRLWRSGEGYAHHLIDPARGTPAWTGVIQATALAPTAARAETLAKTALLSGPAGARRALRHHGGLIVLDSGEVEAIGRATRVEPAACEAVA